MGQGAAGAGFRAPAACASIFALKGMACSSLGRHALPATLNASSAIKEAALVKHRDAKRTVAT